MKFYLPLITSLFLVSASCRSTVAKVETKKSTQATEIIDQTNINQTNIATDINPYIKDNIAPEISVKITGAENGGSGVIIAQRNNTYLVLTNNHVLRDGNKFTIDTHDGETHQATEVENAINSDDDLALLQFKSDKSYQTATINTAATPQAEQTILAVGYSAKTGELVTETGKIERVPDKTLKEGYQIGYSSNIVQGMSGGAILNTDGEVIGINGKSAFPIANSGYDNEDGTKPSAEEIAKLRQLNWGLSINRLLTQVNPEIITAYNLPLPETTDNIESPKLTGWLGDLEAKAKQISVRIDSSSGANGSGVIVAKEGNTYAVLTADHVICEDEARKCIGYTYEIVAPDGKKYPVNIDMVKRQSGVDLAVVRFDSDEQYQIAELANYPVTDNDAVFVAGYPKLSNSTPAQWLFSLGFGLERETGLLGVNDSSLAADGSSLTSSQGSLSGGYEMVYSSITYGGMSGGAVLDRNGRVIGIHGLAEGQTALNSQGSSATKIQLGYSLGIPINTLIGLADRLKIDSVLPIQDNRPPEFNPAEGKTLATAILEIDILKDNATAENWLERGNQLWRLGRSSEAVEAFERAIALKPEFIHLAYYGKSLALLDENEVEAALASFELATEIKPNFVPAFLYKSYVLQRLNRLDEALIAIEKAIALQKDNANLYSQKGNILAKSGQLDEAEIAFGWAIQLDPRSGFYSNRGIVYQKQEKIELALADHNRALKINPRSALAYSNRGGLFDVQGKIELALADYNRALEIDPNLSQAYYNRGIVYQKQGKIELALADYNRALEINPRYAFAYSNRGFLYQKQGKIELALANYNRALEINPRDFRAYNNRGFLYQKQEKIELALADYNRALEINPRYAFAYSNRGFLYDVQGKIELALADYNRVLEINPRDADTYYNRGFLYQKQGKLELALADYNRVLEINPRDADTYYNRGFLYQKQGKLELAAVDYSQAISPPPPPPPQLILIILLLIEIGALFISSKENMNWLRLIGIRLLK